MNELLKEMMQVKLGKAVQEADTYKVYRGRVKGKGDASIGQYYTTDKKQAKFYADWKSSKVGRKGEVIAKTLAFQNPLKISSAETFEYQEEAEKLVPSIKRLYADLIKYAGMNSTVGDKKTDDTIVAIEQALQKYAGKKGYDGIVFGDGEMIIDLRGASVTEYKNQLCRKEKWS